MEAEDTILRLPAGSAAEVLCDHCAYRAAQAEFSFKAGREAALKEAGEWLKRTGLVTAWQSPQGLRLLLQGKRPEDELREGIAQAICTEIQGDSWELTPDQELYRKGADIILAILKAAGWVKLAENQRLPDVPTYFAHDSSYTLSVFDTYGLAQQKMLTAGWRKVEISKLPTPAPPIPDADQKLLDGDKY